MRRTLLQTLYDWHSSTRVLRIMIMRCELLLLSAALLVIACGGDSGVSSPPDGGDGTELRPGLTVTVMVETEASAIAQALGWTAGVPNAEVLIHRIGTDFQWETAVTDAGGTARFPSATRGFYRVAARRVLSEQERQDRKSVV